MNKNKVLLIDALYINAGGGLNLLEYLIESLIDRKIDFCLLQDNRCGKLKNNDKISTVYRLNASLLNRYVFYRKHRNEFLAVLCFANIPSPIKLSCPVYTYVHNANLLKIPKELSLSRKILTCCKRLVIRALASNTDFWVVQTENMFNLLRRFFQNSENIYILPFYKSMPFIENESKRNDYILVGNYTGTRGHEELIEAWRVLYNKGITPKLHLTVDNPLFNSKIEEAKNLGLTIINHGLIPFAEISELYHKCKATVYPSINESLGLGLIEAMESGCDVIAPDLPYVWSVCHPSELFDIHDIDSMVDAVIRYESGTSKKSILTIENKIEELIDLLK